ncbi:MAG TPA: SPOR domain-containing protein [Microvirga sp.]|nr:SPOR domain-containing protein [Microvirga sp.]
MSESVKPRFAVDLDEIERQIAQARGAPSQAAPAARNNDPLAELARIVGQEDPFQSVLASDRPARPRNQANAGLDDLFAVRDEAPAASRVAPFPARQAAPAAPAYRHEDYPQAPVAQQHYDYQAAEPHGHGGYDAGSYDESSEPQAGHGYEPEDEVDYAPREAKRSRKGMIAVGALLGAVVVGGAGAYVLSGGPASISGEPPLIEASNEPVKVQPQNPGGVEIPNQNKQIYERAGSGETKVVNREEQPVDVKQAVRMNSGAGDATGATGSGQHGQPSHALGLGEPKKVRTVTIRPDGTVVHPEGANPRSAAVASALPTMSLPPAAQGTSAAPQPAASTPAPAAATPAPKPAPAAATPAPAASTPASGASPQRVASAQPVAAAPAPEVTATGGFSVQLGVSSSEGDAQAAFERFQKKFSDLEGMPAMIRKAEVNGNTVYRVRVGPMSRDEASSLCSKLQGQGGQCFVAKN